MLRIRIALALILLLSFAQMPYLYYAGLRLAILVACTLFAFQYFFREEKHNLLIALAVLVMYQPIFIIPLSREIWLGMNVIVAAWFGYEFYRLQKNEKKNQNKTTLTTTTNNTSVVKQA